MHSRTEKLQKRLKQQFGPEIPPKSKQRKRRSSISPKSVKPVKKKKSLKQRRSHQPRETHPRDCEDLGSVLSKYPPESFYNEKFCYLNVIRLYKLLQAQCTGPYKTLFLVPQLGERISIVRKDGTTMSHLFHVVLQRKNDIIDFDSYSPVLNESEYFQENKLHDGYVWVFPGDLWRSIVHSSSRKYGLVSTLKIKDDSMCDIALRAMYNGLIAANKTPNAVSLINKTPNKDEPESDSNEEEYNLEEDEYDPEEDENSEPREDDDFEEESGSEEEYTPRDELEEESGSDEEYKPRENEFDEEHKLLWSSLIDQGAAFLTIKDYKKLNEVLLFE